MHYKKKGPIGPNHRTRRLARAISAVVLVTSVSGFAAIMPASADTPMAPTMAKAGASPAYQFVSIDNNADPTFNQLLGINDHGVIAGYFGSGMPAGTHPNKGYTLAIQHRKVIYKNENFPNSKQSQVTAIDNAGDTVGFWVDAAGNNFGFVDHRGTFTSVANPANPMFNQLLGINNHNQVVGFSNDASGNSHAYRYNIKTKKVTPIMINGAVSTQATGINDHGDISGFETDANGTTQSFLMQGKKLTMVEAPDSKSTQAFGVNNARQLVGQYAGPAGEMHGFLWAHGSLQTIDDPKGIGTTTVNGLNNRGQFVGFYTSTDKATHGFVGGKHVPSVTQPSPTSAMAPTPTPIPTPGTPAPSGAAPTSGSQVSGNPTTGNPTTPQPGNAAGMLPASFAVTLKGQATGTVALSSTGNHLIQAKLDLSGITPSVAATDTTPAAPSIHGLEIDSPNGNVIAAFSPVAADTDGQIHTTVESTTPVQSVPAGSVFVVRLGNPVRMNDGGINTVSAQPLATAPVALNSLAVNVTPVEAGGQGSLGGQALFSYDAAKQALTVTINNATGFVPNSTHAAHIHSGSCTVQGPPALMLTPDLSADSMGTINATRVISGVTSFTAPPSGWYINIHQGGSNIILVDKLPALSFRPLLCADLNGVTSTTRNAGNPVSGTQVPVMQPVTQQAMPTQEVAPKKVHW